MSTKTSLWVIWVHKYLIRKGSLWNVNAKSGLGSWIWKKLLKYRMLAQSFTRVEIRSGASTSFWYDDWNQLGNLLSLTGLRGCIDLSITINSTVEQVVQSHRRRLHRQKTLNLIEEEIQRIKLQGLSHEEDIILWKGKSDLYRPGFSIKHTWHSVRTVAVKQKWYGAIWFTLATPKYSIHAWLAVQNRLATGDRLVRWYAQVDTFCILCNHPMETRNHLFF